METGDIIAIAGGIAIVVLVAVLANPHSLSGLQFSSTQATPSPVPLTLTPVPVQIVTSTPEPATPTPLPTIAPPYRIFYSNTPFSYPVFTLPDDMIPFGASEVYLQNDEMVPFAFIQDTRGGITRKFSIPYPVWILNATTTSKQNPQYGDFRMVLCYADNGTVINGMEILNQGTEMRIVHASNVDVYMIISTAYIDQYRIDLITPKNYYDKYTSQ